MHSASDLGVTEQHSFDIEDWRIVVAGEELNDKHINFTQLLLKKQFERIPGLMSTLFLSGRKTPLPTSNALQLMHTRGNQWITATTIRCTNEVVIFDVLYYDVDKPMEELISEIFGVRLEPRMENAPKQEQVKDCGVFALAICTSPAYYNLPNCTSFDQSTMGGRLIQCCENMFNSFSFRVALAMLFDNMTNINF